MGRVVNRIPMESPKHSPDQADSSASPYAPPTPIDGSAGDSSAGDTKLPTGMQCLIAFLWLFAAAPFFLAFLFIAG